MGCYEESLCISDKFLSALENGFGFCSVVFGWDMVDGDYENDIKVTGWHTGYGDFEAQVDLDTFRTIPWEDDVPFFLVDFGKAKAEDLVVCALEVYYEKSLVKLKI